MKKITLALLLVLALAFTSDALAAGGKAWTDAEKAAKEYPDFKVQGEYKCDEMAAQVVAIGKGKYRVTGLNALPGAKDAVKRMTVFEIETKDGKIAGDNKTIKVVEGEKMPDGASIEIKDDVLTLSDPAGRVMKLKKFDRKSPTLGAKPPKGAVVLFDGTSADQFKDGKMTEDKLLQVGTQSKDKFKSHKIHLEFRTPFMPESSGQGRGNSGLYVQGCYEVQILDAFGNAPKDNETGGIYQVAVPVVNACLPPLKWQTYDVDFTAAEFKDGKKVKNARITVLLNGVKIHDDVELPNRTGGSIQGESPDGGPIFLQNHSNPVNFRNIWVQPK